MHSKEKILIIEDNPFNLDIASELLENAGYETIKAEDALTGIQKAKEYHPDAILLDLHLPMKDGYETARMIKADPEIGGTSVIAFTALARDEEQQKALDCGCSGVIVKPIEIEQFADLVGSFIKNKTHVQPSVTVDDTIDKSGLDTSSQGAASGHEEIQRQYQQLKQDYEEFITIASHDLQGPLRKIFQFSEQLKRSASADEARLVDGIQRSTITMQTLLDDLLTLSRIMRAKRPFEKISLDALFSDLLVKYQQTITDTKAEIRIEKLGEIDADPEQIRVLFSALLDNALKFHKAGMPPQITVSMEHAAHNVCHVYFADQGIGFQPEYADRIFKPFQRLHGVSQYPGSGMGLAFAKKIAERHHGTITATGIPGNSAVFTLTLPVTQSDDPL